MRAVLAWSLLGVFFGVSATLPAQRYTYGGGQGHSSKVKVPDDVGREPLEVAKTALGGGDVDRALSIYQDILDRLPDRVAPVFLAPRGKDDSDHILPRDRFAGLRDYVADQIRLIPDGIKRYREREGPRAAADLARALASRDESQLRRIIIRWELTESGPLALAALSDILFQSGRIAESRLCADRLLALVGDHPETRELRSRAILRAAVAHTALGEKAELRSLASSLGGGDAPLSVTWRGAATPLGGVVEQLLAEADKAPPPPRIEKTAASFAKPSWQSHPFSRHDSDRDEVRFRSWDVYVSPASTSYFPVMPAVSDSAVYFCDGLRVEALSLMTGRPLWPAVESPEQDFQGSRHWNLMHEVVLDRGVIYACLEDRPDIKSEAHHQIAGFKPRETIAVRKLWAIDANTGEKKWSHADPEGIRDPEIREFVDRISVNTPPLVVGDRLFVGITYYLGGFRQWLCAFERDTGALIWRTYIGQGQAELNMFGNPVREVVPGYVGEHDGLIVYSTNIGVVAACDAITGAPRWVSAYEQEPVPGSDGQQTNTRSPGWTVTRPLFYGDYAIIAPSDAYDVYAFNLDNGEARVIPGARRTQSNQFRHVVGLYEDTLILAGRKVHAFDLKPLAEGKDARPKWEAPPDGAMAGDATIDGRPAIAGDRLFYTGRGSNAPGSRSRASSYVASIDVRSGRILEEKSIEGAPFRGNIVFSPDAVVVSGFEITAIFDEKEVARRIDAELVKNPEDAELRLRSGRIALQARSIDRAIADLEKARTLAIAGGPRQDWIATAASLALYDLFLDLALDPVSSPKLPANPELRFEKALAYATTPRQQVQALHLELLWAKKAGKANLVREIAGRLLGEFPEEKLRIDQPTAAAMPELGKGTEIKAGLLGALVGAASAWEAEQPAEAIALYQQALNRFADDFVSGPAGTVSIWRYAYSKIAEIIRNKGEAAYAAEERGAEALMEEGRKTGNLDAFRTLLDRYPNSSRVESAWIELSRRLRESGRDRDALRAVQRQLSRYGSVTATLLSELERSLESAAAFESARDILLIMKERFGREKLAGDPKGGDIAQSVDARLKEDPFRALMEPPPIPEGTLGLKLAWTEAPSPQGGEEVGLVVPEGRRPKAADEFVLVHKDGELKALELDSGRLKWSKGARSLGEPVRPLWYDGRLLAILDGDLVVVDPANGKEHWRATPTQMRPLALHAAHGKAYLMLRPILGSRSVTVRAFDIVTGEKLPDREFALSAPMSADQASFGSSPLWLLCRLDASLGSSAVLDGITGELAFIQSTGQNYLPSMLTTNNLLVTQTTTSTTPTAREIAIVARNPKTQQVVWNFKLERVTSSLGPIALTPRLAVFSARFGDKSQVRRDIIALDLETGTTRMSIGLRLNDITQGGAPVGDILLVKFSTSDGKWFIRAYDLKKSAHLWDSVTYGGVNPRLAVYPTKNYAIVRASSSNGDKRTDMIQFFENRTGLLKDSFSLENTALSFRPDYADIDVRDQALILRGGADVSVRK